MRDVSKKNDLGAFAQLNISMVGNPGLAEALLILSKEAGDDPTKIDAIRKAGLEDLKSEQEQSPALVQVDLKNAFIEKYGIKILEVSQVVVTLPEGISRIEFLKEAQAISFGLHGQKAIWPERLSEWEHGFNFNLKLTEPTTIAANTRIEKSNSLKISEMIANGWLDLEIEDLAVAHTAYFIATGQEAFQGDIVRASNGSALIFDGGGLDVWAHHSGRRFDQVYASCALASPN